jgi:hypothetical protein
MVSKRGIAVARSTEGHRPDEGEMRHHKSSQTVKARGRPTGSKNKDKGIIPSEVAGEILDRLKPMLPEEHYEYMRGVLSKGKKIDIERELDVIIMLLNRQLVPALIMESNGESSDQDQEIKAELSDSILKMPAFSKSVSERLKVVQSFMEMKLRLERHKDESKQDKDQPILTVFAKRGIDINRLGIIASAVPGSMGGGADDAERGANGPRAVSDTVPQRQLSEQSSGQSASDWILDSVVDRDDSRSVYEVQLLSQPDIG